MNNNIKDTIADITIESIKKCFDTQATFKEVVVQFTNKEYDGDYTIVLFTLTKKLRKNPLDIGETLGSFLQKAYPNIVKEYNSIGGFLNLMLNDNFLAKRGLCINHQLPKPKENKNIVTEYSSPNTNKPLHLGHLRNIFLGHSVTELIRFLGHNVYSTCVVNDRGIHICKSMVAWKKFANNETPEDKNMKPDHYVGYYYVKFNEALKKEVNSIRDEKNIDEAVALKQSSLQQEAQKMLQLWEQGDEETIQLWEKMNDWVYSGFEETYNKINISFDKIYYESDTYLLGKSMLEEGLKNHTFFKKNDGSVWIDLKKFKQDEKLLLRQDGTSVYMTQDLGLAECKYKDFNYHQNIYVVGNEQNYHFEVLRNILIALKKSYAEGVYHLSYGMVELPSGKMKSREGNVVDADDILEELKQASLEQTMALGKQTFVSDKELNEHSKTLGYGALRFFLLRSDPTKKILFNPKEMIDLNGFTSVFINYSYVRILSLLDKSEYKDNSEINQNINELHIKERELIIHLDDFANVIHETYEKLNPSIIANYVYFTAKKFNAMYNHCPVMTAKTNLKIFRLELCTKTLENINVCCKLLGISLVKKM